MSSITDSMKSSIIVPVVVIEDAQDAVPTAKALLAGGINVMEITPARRRRSTASATWRQSARI